MTRNNILFDDIAAPVFQNRKSARRSAHPEKSQNSQKPQNQNSSKNNKGKDETQAIDLKTKANKLAEDPYLTQSEMGNMDDGTKDKEQKADPASGGNESPNDQKEDETEDAKKELKTLADRSNKILFKAKTVFPFDLFPDTVVIDANKIDIILKSFFATETVTSVILKEIMDVRVHTALFMAKLIIDYGPHPLKVKSVFVTHLRRSDALKAKEIIDGLQILYRGENIDTTKLPPEETIGDVIEIGKVEEEE